MDSCKAFLRKWIGDWDEVLAYDSVQIVRVLDRRLGQIYYVSVTVILLYVCGWVMFYKRMYLDDEKTNGWIITKVSKPQMSLSHPGVTWDTFDRITNPGEQGAVFIPTRILITRGQHQDNVMCESPLHNCSANDDCDIGQPDVQSPECVNGHCMRRQWCPAEDPSVDTTETHLLEFEKVELWFQTYLHYHKFMLDLSTAGEKEQVHSPQARANTYKLFDLVKKENPDPLALVENGAVMQLNAVFNCNLDAHDCALSVDTMNVDITTGYNYVHNYYYMEDGVHKRDSYRMFGIRLFTFATGFGEKTSLSMIMLQLSSAISMFNAVEIFTDWCMTSLLPERTHYLKYKIKPTEDFNNDDK